MRQVLITKFNFKKCISTNIERIRSLINRIKNNNIVSDGKKFTIKKALRDEMLKDVGKILSQARAIQIRNDDGSFCFKMTEIEPGSVYSLLDIQDGDTVCQINGNKIIWF